jgi:hypothetical protein
MSLPLTLEEAKIHLRLDTDEADSTINQLILLSTEVCQNYMRSDLPEECPESIRQACLILIGYFNENLEGKEPIPDVVYRLLDPYRVEGF